jgi:hypothetical protein
LVVAFFRTCLVAAQPAIRHQLLTLKKTRPTKPQEIFRRNQKTPRKLPEKKPMG